jgi:hypothetical protein
VVSGPYFIVDGHDASVHDSLADVAASLEPYDVEAARLRLFRADGAELRLTTRDPRPPSPVWQHPVVATDEVVGSDPATLAEALRACLLAEQDNLAGRRTQFVIDRDTIEHADLELLVEEFRMANSKAGG